MEKYIDLKFLYVTYIPKYLLKKDCLRIKNQDKSFQIIIDLVID